MRNHDKFDSLADYSCLTLARSPFCSGGVLAPHQTDNAAIRQSESNFTRPTGCARMGF
jgi:hypothetical protein